MADDPSPGPPVARPFFQIAPLLRAARIASDARKLILVAVGIVALHAGWSGLAVAFGDRSSLPVEIDKRLFLWIGLVEGWNPTWIAVLARDASEPFRVVVTPFLDFFDFISEGRGSRSQSALMGLWAVIVWGIVGGAIARIAVVEAACGRRIGIVSASRFAARKSGPLIGAPLIPFLAIAVFAAINAAIGLVSRIPGGIGATVGAILHVIALALGLVMALILIGLALGWPLMVATIVAEDEDAPDALSRSYSYVNQRFARYAARVAAAWAIGMAGVFLANQFAWVVTFLSSWSVKLGSAADLGDTAPARSILVFWEYVIVLLVHGWAYSYFWSAASVLYLILRHDVDGKAWDDVALPEQAADTFVPAGPPEPAKPDEAEV